MLDDLNELRTFRAVLEAGSLSAAARALGVSLAVVSKRLATLERRVGARLIHRTTRTLSVTEAGAALLPGIERALEAIGSAEAALAHGRAEPTGVLRVSAPVSFGRRHVAPVLGELVRVHPRLAVALTLDDRLADLVADRLDVVVRIGEPADSTAMRRKLADNARILVASPAYLDRAGRPAHPRDALGLAFLRYGDAVGPWRLQGPDGERAELAAPCRLRVDNGDAVHDWALGGHGVMLKSRIDVAADLEAGRLEEVLPDWSGGDAPIMALYPTARHLPLKTSVFLDAMAAHLRTQA